MGARAFSHDSIFIPDGGAESEQTVQAMSQDNILGKVKTLQVRQLEPGRSEPQEGWLWREWETPSLALSDGWGGLAGAPAENFGIFFVFFCKWSRFSKPSVPCERYTVTPLYPPS